MLRNDLNNYIRLFLISFALGVGIGSGSISRNISDPKPPEASIQSNVTNNFSLAEYQRLNLDMSVAEVEAILGRGTEIERTKATAHFVWINLDTSEIRVEFQAGKLKSKKQFGLK
ncbi:hypothetical protein [Nostoc sphaeroides]|uniref:Lipoprotein SmpA/OmlA domain-containing protein n=1 Tax=Nostoc sphaeroides CCNUC1 TaxID=2653204 RepID=A0A5P8VWK1_9NOSO|nr:hypothetical protein [Nostoc sphaeroides]QFS44269.1 hypothetical protein GXM_01742 [Nostoc sphaeroides CCNUC1]